MAGGGKTIVAELPHSVPRAAACANICRRDFLLFSNCIRAVSWSVSLVVNLIVGVNCKSTG